MLLCFWRAARPSHLEQLWAEGVDDALTAVQHTLPWAVGSHSKSRDSQLARYSPSFVCEDVTQDLQRSRFAPFFKSKFVKTIIWTPESADLVLCFQPSAAAGASDKTSQATSWRCQPCPGIMRSPDDPWDPKLGYFTDIVQTCGH